MAAVILYDYAMGEVRSPFDTAQNCAFLATCPLTYHAAVALLAVGVAKQLSSIEAKLMSNMADVMAGITAVKTDFETFRDGVNSALASALANASNPADVQGAVDAIAALDSEIKSSGAVATAPAAVAAAVPTDMGAASAPGA